MAHFYGELQGNRGATSRTSSKQTGMSAHIRGWELGVQVRIDHRDGRDVVSVFRTGGSNGRRAHELIAVFTDTELRLSESRLVVDSE